MISNFLEATLGTVNINKVFLGNGLIWIRDKGLAKDYPGTGWYKATDTGTVFSKDVPELETHVFSDSPKEYVSVYTKEDAKLYGTRAATSNVTNMASAFYGATSFNEDISSWDVSSVTDMDSLFYNVPEFNSDISSWDVSNVTNMNYMFDGATSFNQDISNWDVFKIKVQPIGFVRDGNPNWVVAHQPQWGTTGSN